MQIRTEVNDGKGVLTLDGRFDFNSHRDFRAASDKLLEDAAVKEVEINFSRVEYLDSSALGMLLLLREKVDGAGKKVVLSGLKGTVKQVLDIANFSKLFAMRD
ncbi:MAG: STAS domain-containing protein [Thiobacillaceae bacterium]|jgi:anti-anti-sigma factor|nr:STAS domain-containing protein [Thiobacillaceae bacterium]